MMALTEKGEVYEPEAHGHDMTEGRLTWVAPKYCTLGASMQGHLISHAKDYAITQRYMEQECGTCQRNQCSCSLALADLSLWHTQPHSPHRSSKNISSCTQIYI